MRSALSVLKHTLWGFLDDDCPSMAAALAYYTVFSLPPLLLIIIATAGSMFGRAAVQGRISAQIGDLVGRRAADQVETMIAEVSFSDASDVAAFAGIAALLLASTSAFVQLQYALNRTWEVKPDPNRGMVKEFLLKRILSFGMIVAIGFLLLVSLALSAAMAAFGDTLALYLPPELTGSAVRVAGYFASFCVITGLFASMYKVLPDAKVHWRDVLTGSALTALLFMVGKYLVGLYLGRSSVLSPFGTAGSLALIMLWTYYSSMIVLFGAEFTRAWAQHRGHWARPEEGAVQVVVEEKQLEGPA